MISQDKILIVVAGPTASGKTKAAISLAQHYRTEIISFDSRQFYTEMSIGTAKPTIEELQTVPHHFIGHLSIEDEYTAGTFAKDAEALANNLFKKYDVVITTGGSGLFMRAWLEGFDTFPEVATETREQLNKIFEEKGIGSLQQLLKEKDPAYYDEVDKENPRRLLRALEVTMSSGQPYSSFKQKEKKKLPYRVIKTGIDVGKEELYERINHRVDEMISAGLLEEVKSLYPQRQLNALNTVGYKELFDYLDKKYSLEEAINKIKQDTRNYAKRQMTWFRKEKDISWVKNGSPEELLKVINAQL